MSLVAYTRPLASHHAVDMQHNHIELHSRVMVPTMRRARGRFWFCHGPVQVRRAGRVLGGASYVGSNFRTTNT